MDGSEGKHTVFPAFTGFGFGKFALFFLIEKLRTRSMRPEQEKKLHKLLSKFRPFAYIIRLLVSP